jgi:hypothetical protein
LPRYDNRRNTHHGKKKKRLVAKKGLVEKLSDSESESTGKDSRIYNGRKGRNNSETRASSSTSKMAQRPHFQSTAQGTRMSGSAAAGCMDNSKASADDRVDDT